MGIGSLSSTINEAYALSDDLWLKGIKVVMVGPHVSFMPEEALAHCDYVVRGKGDTTFLSLVKALEAGQSPKEIKGLSGYAPFGRPPADEKMGKGKCGIYRRPEGHGVIRKTLSHISPHRLFSASDKIRRQTMEAYFYGGK